MIRTRSTHAWPALSVAALSAVLMSACTGAAPPPADLASLLDTDVPVAARTCLEQACAEVTTAQELATCREASCAAREDSWTVVPTRIRYDGEMAFVQARLSYQAGGYGGVDVPRSSEAYVGCTLITTDGREIDLAVTTLFPGDLERPFTLNTEVGADVRDIIFGVWDRKVEPCDSDRMGCQQYGFLLDGNLATWPPNVYSEGVRQRIPPTSVSAQFVDAGLGSAFPAARDKALATLRAELEVFGASLESVESSPAGSFQASTVLIRDDHDVLIGRRVAATLSADAAVQPDPGLPADLVVVLSGDAATHEKALAACADARDQDYDRCVAGL